MKKSKISKKKKKRDEIFIDSSFLIKIILIFFKNLNYYFQMLMKFKSSIKFLIKDNQF